MRPLLESLLVPLGIPLVWELGFGHGAGAPSVPLGLPGTLVAEGTRPHLTVAAS